MRSWGGLREASGSYFGSILEPPGTICRRLSNYVSDDFARCLSRFETHFPGTSCISVRCCCFASVALLAAAALARSRFASTRSSSKPLRERAQRATEAGSARCLDTHAALLVLVLCLLLLLLLLPLQCSLQACCSCSACCACGAQISRASRSMQASFIFRSKSLKKRSGSPPEGSVADYGKRLTR